MPDDAQVSLDLHGERVEDPANSLVIIQTR
jgi:hypothetical protein